MTLRFLPAVLLLGWPLTAAAEEPQDFSNLDGQAFEKAHAEAAEKAFAQWKAASADARPELATTVVEHAVFCDRQDLAYRMLVNDRLAETKIPAPAEAKVRKVHIVDRTPLADSDNHNTVWRRITMDRVEIWTPLEGKLFDGKGKLLKKVAVKRGDGWGREWFGAFLPDGSWATTDLDELDKTLTLYSKDGKRTHQIKGASLAPQKKNQYDEDQSAVSLIAWARSNKDGKAWIVSVGSEFGRGIVKVTPEGKSKPVDSPWTECLPQQLGPRGMYTSKTVQSDDGAMSMLRSEPSHGSHVGWPTYTIGDIETVIPDGYFFGILPGGETQVVESDPGETLPGSDEDKAESHLWFFDPKGAYQHWANGTHAGVDLRSGEMILSLSSGDSLRITKDFKLTDRHSYASDSGGEKLVPKELHEDLGLGFFQTPDGKLALGTWSDK